MTARGFTVTEIVHPLEPTTPDSFIADLLRARATTASGRDPEWSARLRPAPE